MPKPGEHTPISDEEAEEMVRRMITTAEDLGQIYDMADWEDFVSSKLGTERGYDPYGTQYAVFERGRGKLIEQMAHAGFKVEYPIVGRPQEAHIRDLTTGRFVSWKDVQVGIVPFR